jgi:hypothetical protein
MQTIYIRTACWGGFLSLMAFLIHGRGLQSDLFLSSGSFLLLWVAVGGLTVAGDLGFRLLDRRRTGQPLGSPTFRKAFFGLAPALLIGAVFTILLWSEPFKEAIFWLLFYGLGLLGTQHVATRSTLVLGWIFALTGVDITAYMSLMRLPDPGAYQASALMAVTFGGYHLLYAGIGYLQQKNLRKSA